MGVGMRMSVRMKVSVRMRMPRMRMGMGWMRTRMKMWIEMVRMGRTVMGMERADTRMRITELHLLVSPSDIARNESRRYIPWKTILAALQRAAVCIC